MTVETTPVIVVGCGPAGILSSMLLTKLGIAHRVIESRGGLHELPQAHVVKLRTMEILRQFDLDETVIEKATPTSFQQYITWRESLAGTVFGSVSMVGRKGVTERHQATSPTYPANIPQNEFEEITYDSAKESKFAEFSFDLRCVDVFQDNDKATVVVEDRAGQRSEIVADYVLGADGVASTVREKLGFELQGDASLQKWIAIVIDADLTELLSEFPGVLHWIRSPSCTGVFIVHNVRNCSVFMVPYDESVVDPAGYTEEDARETLAAAFGAEVPCRIVGIDNWNMQAQVANGYGNGRIFLVGDAAHRFPPTGGMGLNTGAQDVFNLVWKIAYCLSGVASSELLQSYELECKPVALVNCAHSKSNFLNLFDVDKTIFGGSSEMDDSRLELLKSNSEESRRELADIQSIIDEQLPHFDTTALDLGYKYESGAVIEDEVPEPEGNVVVFEFEQFCRSGYRFPHMRLQCGEREISSIDLIDYRAFTIFCGDEDRWSAAAEDAADRAGLTINVVAIAEEGRYQDAHGDWGRLAEIEVDGAVLVRPDGQVCWRSITEPDSPADELARVLKTIVSAD